MLLYSLLSMKILKVHLIVINVNLIHYNLTQTFLFIVDNSVNRNDNKLYCERIMGSQ